jgi:transcriptional repressor NrdR
MRCSQCASADTKVIESRDVTEGQAIRRRRSCIKCGYRFTTYERVEHPQVVVIKNNGVRELFNRDKLLAGLYRACEKTTVSNLQIEQLVTDIEKQLQQQADSEVSTSKIGDLVMEGLANLNEVAYVRFASVYRRFTDIAGFEQELTQIKSKKK